MPVVTQTDTLSDGPHGEAPPNTTHESPPIKASDAVTTDIPPVGFKIPMTLDEMFAPGGSKYGHSMVSSYLSCPERARLNALRIIRKRGIPIDPEYEVPVELDALGYGTLIHALMAIRKVYGMKTAMDWLAWLPKLGSETRMNALHLMKTWDYEFPMPEAKELLGVEVEVYTDIGDGRGGPLIRTVRYDELSRRPALGGGFEVISNEHKSMASSPGQNGVNQYLSQMMTQVKLWNGNPSLVEKYGRMAGVEIDCLIKTKVPKAQRSGVIEINQFMEDRITEYLRLPEQIAYPRAADGGYPRMLHSCFGKYSPCSYIDLCLRGHSNLYEQKQDPPKDPQTDPLAVAGD